MGDSFKIAPNFLLSISFLFVFVYNFNIITTYYLNKNDKTL